MVSQSEFSAPPAFDASGTPAHESEQSRGAGASSESQQPSAARIAVIERRALVRECLVKALGGGTDWSVLPFASAEELLEAPNAQPVSLILLSVGGGALANTEVGDLTHVSRLAEHAPVAVMSDSEDPSQIVGVLERHVRGYIPTSLPLNVAIEALRLVKAGGVYVPASSLIASQQQSHVAPAETAVQPISIFTSRQLAVISALRKGKANKIIAYELDMRESTVKVHVRNIMKKLKARNRTEVAYLANSMLGSDKR